MFLTSGGSDSAVKVAWDSADALRDVIDSATPERVAAFFCEPIIGALGVFPPPPGYPAKVREICRQSGVLYGFRAALEALA